jgi:hypothetical protein
LESAQIVLTGFSDIADIEIPSKARHCSNMLNNFDLGRQAEAALSIGTGTSNVLVFEFDIGNSIASQKYLEPCRG